MEGTELKYMQKEQSDVKFKDILAKSTAIKQYFERQAEEINEQLPILDVTEKFWVNLMDFNTKYLPLINFLGNEAIEAEHWIEIQALTGINVTDKVGEEGTI